MDSDSRPTGGRFPLGRTVATRGALVELSESDIRLALGRHLRGDWGDLGAEDYASNERALAQNDRLLSAYHSVKGVKFYIITEWDRSVTTVLLPEEY